MDEVGQADDGTLAEAFWSVARRLRHLTHQTVAPLGITPGQARAISVLARHGGMRLNELSTHLRIAPRSTTEVVDALEETGLVERTPDPADRRAIVVALSGRGSELAGQLASARTAEGAAFFGKLSDSDRETLAKILRELRL